MCFTIHSDHIRKKIAKEDILCYKHIFLENMSLIYDYQYEVNIANPKIKLVKLKTIIEGGYYSYDNPHMSSIFLDYVTHSDQVIKRATFKIPKGTGYYYNPIKHEYVSETIIML